ncbi:MAG: glycerate kinase [Saprospiraceae bacterium]|nr:glycerate kinase [Saprospiraceae bacterium]
MKILLCPDKFKGSLSAERVCQALQEGLLDVNPNLQIINHPMADGGDGSIDILNALLSLAPILVQTFDPLGRPIEAQYFHSETTAYIELASASGITLLDQKERNPLITSTMGTGVMIKDALDKGFEKINLFIGGSATNDAGIGIANVLGYDFLDKNGNLLHPNGVNLSKIKQIKHPRTYDHENLEIIVLCDVTNPMYGPQGAAFTYGAQKGASPRDIHTLDDGLKNYADLLLAQQKIDLLNQPGMGAAGAVGASLVGLLNARLENGFQLLSRETKLENAIQNSNFVITGEGKVDATSFQGKVVGNIASICKKNNKPFGIVGGIIDELSDISTEPKFRQSIISLAKDFNEAMNFPEKFLVNIGKAIGTQLKQCD